MNSAVSKSKIFIDASTFMGMHSVNEEIRESSLALFTHNFNGEIFMSLEQVGLCDHIIWQYSRELQDIYYPFMDSLHSMMKIHRIGYSSSVFQLLNGHTDLKKIPIQKALVITQVINTQGVLFTHDQELLKLVESGYIGNFEEFLVGGFPKNLDALYQASRQLKIEEKLEYYA